MKKTYLYAGISVLFWSTTTTVTKLLLGSLSSMMVLAVTSGFAFAFLLILCACTGKLKLLRSCSWKDYGIMFGMGTLGIFIYHLLLYIGIDILGAGRSMIINYLWPIFTVVSAVILLKEKMTIRKWIAIVMSFLGIIVVMADSSGGALGSDAITGGVLCVLAAASYGIFVVLNKRLPYDKTLGMMMYYFASFVVSGVYVLFTGEQFAPELPQLAGLVYMGVFNSAIAFVTWALAMRDGNTAAVSNLAYLSPVLSLVWAALLLSERIGWSCILGLALIIGGIFVQMTGEKQVKK